MRPCGPATNGAVVFQIMDHELDVYGRWPTIHDFRVAWIFRGLAASTLDPILTLNTVPIPPGAAAATEAPKRAGMRPQAMASRLLRLGAASV
jgi:hypothetical protein